LPITVGEVLTDINDAPASFRLQAAAAELAELLRQSYWAQDGSYTNLLIFSSVLEDEMPNNPQIEELMEMMILAKRFGKWRGQIGQAQDGYALSLQYLAAHCPRRGSLGQTSRSRNRDQSPRPLGRRYTRPVAIIN